MIFAKGHGTENDFVVLVDLPARLELAPQRVAALCDRRRGLGADGVLRVTTAGAAVAAKALTAIATAPRYFLKCDALFFLQSESE